MVTKTLEDIRQDIIDDYNAKIPQLDLTEGTPERDIFVEAPIAGYLVEIWEGLEYTQKLHAPFTYYPDLEEEDINNFIATYGVTPETEGYSTGTVTFYTYNQPTTDVEITPKTIVATANTNVEFEVVGYYIMYASIASSYYNALTSRWEIECNIQAVNPGPSYSANASAITKVVTKVSGIDGCINSEGVYGGTPVESILSRITRAKGIFQGKGLGSTLGLEAFVQNLAPSANVIRANDSLMVRDEQNGGCVDIYVKETTIDTYTEDIVVTQSGLDLGLNVTYTSTYLTLSMPPVHSITSVLFNGVAVATSNYSLSIDTGILAKSTRAADKVLFTTAVVPGTYRVTYTYNTLLYTIEEQLALPANAYDNRDVLAREQTAVGINVYMVIKVYTGQDFDTVSDRCTTLLSTYLSELTSDKIEITDLISIVKSDSGVDNINKNTAAISCVDLVHTPDSYGDITLDKNEYIEIGTIDFQEWT